MKLSMQQIRLFALATALALGTGGAATADESTQGCCYPGTIYYYDAAGALVGMRLPGCGDPGWGIVTLRSRAIPGCAM